MEAIKIRTYLYVIDHNSPSASRYYYIGSSYNGNYPVFTPGGHFAGTLTANEIKEDYRPAVDGRGWNKTI